MNYCRILATSQKAQKKRNQRTEQTESSVLKNVINAQAIVASPIGYVSEHLLGVCSIHSV